MGRKWLTIEWLKWGNKLDWRAESISRAFHWIFFLDHNSRPRASTELPIHQGSEWLLWWTKPSLGYLLERAWPRLQWGEQIWWKVSPHQRTGHATGATWYFQSFWAPIIPHSVMQPQVLFQQVVVVHKILYTRQSNFTKVKHNL